MSGDSVSKPPPEEIPTPTHALVRPPGRAFAEALTTQDPRPTIDVALAQEQHRVYAEVLRAVGLEVLVLKPDERHPDGCFVQDLAVIFGDLAVICRPGAPSRRGEEATVQEVLSAHKRIAQIEPPGTLEGGDVMRVGRRLFVGLSERTNRSGKAQLRDLVEPLGASVVPIPVEDGLHLMSACAYLGRGVLLAAGSRAGLPEFLGLDVIFVPQEEAYGANCLAVGDQAILPEGCPRLQAALKKRGFRVWTVAMSEFAKADGGVTCLSLLW